MHKILKLTTFFIIIFFIQNQTTYAGNQIVPYQINKSFSPLMIIIIIVLSVFIMIIFLTVNIHWLDKVRQKQSFLNNIVENANIIILVWKMDGTIVLFNKFAEQITGYHAKEVIGKKWMDIMIPNEECTKITEICKCMMNGKIRVNSEYEILCKDKSKIEISWHNSMIYDKNNKPIFIVSAGIDITERKKAEKQVYHIAYHDSLTNLPNRTLFIKTLNAELEKSKKSLHKGAIFFIDLDNFKLVNDTLGHAFGDELLKEVGSKLVACVGNSCTVARLGGDEFIILKPDIYSTADLIKVANLIIEIFQHPWTIKKHQFHLTSSIGIAVYPDCGNDVSQLLKNADTAMYRAKKSGKNHYQIFKQVPGT
ncbi:MAG: hypothetical protein PWQ70_939 [Clostridiales bacterium]|jgi:diguanylate cyclase (GGDEF)-like protein/PAS domain S-box-containing protein|nr:hypothetical protein [Clostridiales bacterium]